MRWLCIFGWHEPIPIKVLHYNDNDYKGNRVPSFNLTSRCRFCGKIKVERHFGGGHPSMQELLSCNTPSEKDVRFAEKQTGYLLKKLMKDK